MPTSWRLPGPHGHPEHAHRGYLLTSVKSFVEFKTLLQLGWKHLTRLFRCYLTSREIAYNRVWKFSSKLKLIGGESAGGLEKIRRPVKRFSLGLYWNNIF